MGIIFIGPPGSGKGTQAKLLSERLHLTLFGMGDTLREAVQLKTPAGQQAAPYVAAGQLVPDEVVNQIVRERFDRDDRPVHFLMDGYPRTVTQARVFEQILNKHKLVLDAVVQLVVDDEEIVKRLRARGREDDKEETVRQRLKVYHQTHRELLDYYRNQGLLLPVDGTGDVNAIHERLMAELKRLESKKSKT